MSRQIVTSVGFDADMMETLKARAKENDRSVAGEIKHLVRTALKADGAAA